jgi:hypothetical protein
MYYYVYLNLSQELYICKASRGVDRAACLPFLDLRLAGLDGGGDGMPITAFDGPGEGIVFR